MKIIKLSLMIIIVLSIIGCGSGDGGRNDGEDTLITGDPVWNKGIGVITESTTAIFSAYAASSNASCVSKEISIKEWLAGESFVYNAMTAYTKTSFTTSALSTTDWKDAVKYIFLDWNSLNGASYYQVYFLGKDGSQNVKVWDSRDPHPNDRVYTTKAFLDLSDELKKDSVDLVPEAGEYQFKVIAYNKSYSKEYPAITVSIGRLLDKYLKEDEINISGNQLSWPEIGGASDGYKATVYSDAALTTCSRHWDNAVSPVDLSILPAGDYYGVVFAYADKNGKVAEVTYAIRGFTLN